MCMFGHMHTHTHTHTLLISKRVRLDICTHTHIVMLEQKQMCMAEWFQIGKGLLRCMHGNFHGTADLVPVDIATNAIIAAAWYTATQRWDYCYRGAPVGLPSCEFFFLFFFFKLSLPTRFSLFLSVLLSTGLFQLSSFSPIKPLITYLQPSSSYCPFCLYWPITSVCLLFRVSVLPLLPLSMVCYRPGLTQLGIS